ncbi:uncharacterized protein LOC111092489 isoform X1 [Canis lupus familiaris]|uniref:uncharacterized protein LOC111092489 isoform X1 n=1 Tax=Canis lupus familiaris TaxID=9615 RepID=UPI0018F7DB13|nr:uncharacterized protein LOC111092489 isoform X1 [Canis lupus familiaris]
MEEAAGSPGAGLPPVGGAAASPRRVPPALPSSSSAASFGGPPQPLPSLPTASTVSWSSTVDGDSTPRSALSLRPAGAARVRGVERRCGASRRGPTRACPGRHIHRGGSSLFTVYTYVFGARHGAVRSPRSQPRGQGGLFRLTLAVAGGTAAAGGGQMGDERAQAGEAADKGSGRSSSGSLTSGLTPGHWNQDLSRRQTLNQLRFSAPGNHHSTVYLYDFDICKDATDYRACYQSMR